MSDKPSFQIEIVTPVGVVFSGQAYHVMIPGADGYFGVLANHTPLTAVMQTGRLTVNSDAGELQFATSGGFVEVAPERIALLAETAEKADNIDQQRAEAAVKRAEERLAAKKENIDFDRARLALLRGLNRLQVARHE
jgi:F-type H+-transporting ATPase subunit epsilon